MRSWLFRRPLWKRRSGDELPLLTPSRHNVELRKERLPASVNPAGLHCRTFLQLSRRRSQSVHQRKQLWVKLLNRSEQTADQQSASSVWETPHGSGHTLRQLGLWAGIFGDIISIPFGRKARRLIAVSAMLLWSTGSICWIMQRSLMELYPESFFTLASQGLHSYWHHRSLCYPVIKIDQWALYARRTMQRRTIHCSWILVLPFFFSNLVMFAVSYAMLIYDFSYCSYRSPFKLAGLSCTLMTLPQRSQRFQSGVVPWNASILEHTTFFFPQKWRLGGYF